MANLFEIGGSVPLGDIPPEAALERLATRLTLWNVQVVERKAYEVRFHRRILTSRIPPLALRAVDRGRFWVEGTVQGQVLRYEAVAMRTVVIAALIAVWLIGASALTGAIPLGQVIGPVLLFCLLLIGANRLVAGMSFPRLLERTLRGMEAAPAREHS